MRVIYYQGIEGSFSHEVAEQISRGYETHFELKGTKRFAEIFSLVAQDKTALGVIPLENSIAGAVGEVLDLLYLSPLTLVGEYHLSVMHHLIGYGKLEEVRTIFSHPKALEQCTSFLDDLSDIEAIATSDTARAIHHVSIKKESFIGAIGSARAASLYNVPIIKSDIQDNKRNVTRFGIISHHPYPIVGDMLKYSVAFELKNEPGTLVRVLQCLADFKLNMTKIDSRPRPGAPLEYLFFIDFEGIPAVSQDALARVRELCDQFRCLGWYPSHAQGIRPSDFLAYTP